MADNSFKINKSANFNPQPGLPANPVDGDFYYDGNIQSFVYFHNGKWANFDSVGVVTATDPMTSAQFTPAIVQNSVIKVMGGTTPTHLTGISASFSAKEITVYNGGTSYITVEHEDASEPTANNRIHTPTAGDMNLIAGEVAKFVYDIVQNRWLLVSISSQAGAQLLATTTSPGIVTLHQASLFPFDGIVFSDGDKDTATGIVGLDVNKAVSLNPINSATALTINAASNALGIDIVGASGSPAMRIVGNAPSGFNSAALFVSNNGTAPAASFVGGTGSWAVTMQGGPGNHPGGLSQGTGTAIGFVTIGNGGTTQTDIHLTNGVVGLYAGAGSAGGDAIVAQGVGAGYAGIHAYGGTNGHGIVADAGAGGYAGVFNGNISGSGTLTLSGLATVGGLAVTASSGITTADGFSVAATTANTSTKGGVFIDTTDTAAGTWSSTGPHVHFGTSGAEGMGSKRTAGGNQFGLDLFTNNTSRLSIAHTGDVTVANNLTVSGSLTISSGNLTVNAITANANITANNELLCVFDTVVDSNDLFGGTFTSSQNRLLRFGATSSGEAIGSKRTSGGNQFGLDLYTNFTSRLAISNAGAVTIPGPVTMSNANSLFLNSITSIGSTVSINGLTTISSTLTCNANVQIGAQLDAGTNGGSYIHLFRNNGLVPPISLTGARDPVGQGDSNGGFWFGSSNNLTGNGTAWRLNICIGGNVYSWNVDNVWAIL